MKLRPWQYPTLGLRSAYALRIRASVAVIASGWAPFLRPRPLGNALWISRDTSCATMRPQLASMPELSDRETESSGIPRFGKLASSLSLW
eukprot:scaffold5763_cov249-Pinguiococcus_pyrenoidosus.AAC.7